MAGAVIVYVFLRLQVWSKPEAESVASHGLWVGIIGWFASSLQGAMNAGILRANPTASNAPVTSEQIATALVWPVLAALTVHGLGQLSYPAPKAPHRYAELTVRRIRDFLPRKLAWTTAGIFAFAASVIAWIATLPGHTPVLPSPPKPAPSVDYNGYAGQGQDGRIPGWELASWLGGVLLVLAVGTWLILLLIARRRRLETLDGDDNRVLRSIAANRLLRTVATIAAGLASIAGNFAAQPAPGALWQSSWTNFAGFANMAVLLVMLGWRVPQLPSLVNAPKAIRSHTLRTDPRTHGAARLTISLGAALGVVGGLGLLAGAILIYVPDHSVGPFAFPGLVAVVAMLVLLAIAGGDLLIGRNYGSPEAPALWPRQPVSRGLLSFAIGSGLMFAAALVFSIAAQVQPFGPNLWLAPLLATAAVFLVSALAIFAVRLRPGIPETEGDRGLDAALRAISMYRIVRMLAAYLLAQAAVLLIASGDAWYELFPVPEDTYTLGPSPATLVGMFLAVAAGLVAITPVRSLLRTIPRGRAAKLGEPAQ